MSAFTPVALDVASIQRRTIRTLVASQAFGAVGLTIGIATASLLAEEISGSERQAGLAQTSQVLGAAVAAYLLALLMARRGRRFGLVTGNLIGAGGGVLCVVAGVLESMPVLLLGATLLGATTAANNGARYAATDLAEPRHRARSLAVVVWATTIGAVVGPNLTGLSTWVAARLHIPDLTGPFAVGAVGMLLSALLLFVRLRPDPLLTAQAGSPSTSRGGTSWGRVSDAVRERPVLAAAVLGLAGAHAVMVSVMVMTPLHMAHGGSHLDVIGYGISLHVLGMFAFSPLVGLAADKAGRAPVLAVGGVVLIGAVLLCGSSPEGTSWRIFAGLFWLGLGWSLASVAASTLVADHAPPEARTDVQGAADLVMGLSAAAAGGLAGVIVGGPGFGWLNVFAGCLAAVVVVAAVWATRHGARRPVQVFE
ncbi:MFS transporter [Nocardioides jensenii]|uniref:MFS transporter n=1 Tax=Nocardioides jensenii TaxID=1843 RepID=UPI00083612FD|nr:MFS transporter [Nocardioides jensenii]